MPKYYDFKVAGYYLYFTSFCVVECMHVHASDKKLTEGGSAKFFVKAKTTDYESRFKLVYAVKDGPSTGSGTFAFISNGNIIVYGEGTLQVIDMTGRILICRDAMHCVSTTGMTPGVYVLRLINGDDVKTQKIVIQ